VPAPAVPAVLRPVAQVEPTFPREGQGIGPGGVVLQARLVVAPNGTVSQVSFVQSSAATRVFERAARSALLQWRYPAGAGERVVMQSLRFSEE
jgi:outer membrane biosynthesis protein TonB